MRGRVKWPSFPKKRGRRASGRATGWAPRTARGQLIHLVPDIDFDAQRRFRQGTQAAEVIDYFAEHFATRRQE